MLLTMEMSLRLSCLINWIACEKADLKAQMTILFPQVLLGDYDEAALWLCTHRYYLCMNVRDFFSAGGQYDMLNGEKSFLSPSLLF